jgi:hypothetical protein
MNEVPYRLLTCEGNPDGLERTGSSPVAGLAADRLQPAPAGLKAGVEDALAAREDGQFVRDLLAEIAARKHHAWLVGGTVRDLLANGPDSTVKDFDLTGTAGPACLESMIRLRRRSGVADYDCRRSPQNIWSVSPRGQNGPRLVEYKPLARTGFRLPVWGGSLEEDAGTRDLTFNALYYDRECGMLADPCGQGRAHLDKRVLVTPLRGKDPVEQAAVVLRCLKFWLRGQDLDTAQIVQWISDELPADPAETIPDLGWKRLASVRRRCVLDELDGRDELTVAAEFGHKAVRLIQEIRVRA